RHSLHHWPETVAQAARNRSGPCRQAAANARKRGRGGWSALFLFPVPSISSLHSRLDLKRIGLTFALPEIGNLIAQRLDALLRQFLLRSRSHETQPKNRRLLFQHVDELIQIVLPLLLQLGALRLER